MGDTIRCPKCGTYHYRNDPCLLESQPRVEIDREVLRKQCIRLRMEGKSIRKIGEIVCRSPGYVLRLLNNVKEYTSFAAAEADGWFECRSCPVLMQRGKVIMFKYELVPSGRQD